MLTWTAVPGDLGEVRRRLASLAQDGRRDKTKLVDSDVTWVLVPMPMPTRQLPLSLVLFLRSAAFYQRDFEECYEDPVPGP